MEEENKEERKSLLAQPNTGALQEDTTPLDNAEVR